jgi:DnaK suppressor protein
MDETRNRVMERLRQRSREVQETLQGLLATQKEYYAQRSGDGISDETDHAQMEDSVSRMNLLIERKSREYHSTNRLLDRMMKDEEYGTCENCGDFIPEERLLIVPETTLCIECQRELERSSRSRRMVLPSGGAMQLPAASAWGDFENVDDLSVKESGEGEDFFPLFEEEIADLREPDHVRE